MSISRFKHWSIRLVCLVVYCFLSIVTAQNQPSQTGDIIAFQKSLQKIPFNDIVEEYYNYRIKDSAKAATIIQYLRDNFSASTDENEVAETYLTLASWQKRNGNIKAALANLDIGIKTAKQQNNKPLLYEGYNRKGSYLFQYGQNERALESLLKALKVAKEMNAIKEHIQASNNIILIKMQVKDNLGAIDVYFENLKLIKESGDPSLEKKKIPIYQGLTKAFIDLEEYEKANAYATNGLKLSEQMESVDFQAYFTTFLGEIATKKRDFNKANSLFKKAKQLIDAAGGNKTLDIFLKLYVGKNYAAQNKHELAVKEFLECEELLIESGVSYLSIQELYIGLAESYLALENVEESSNYFKKAYDVYAENDKKRTILNSRITQDALENLKEQISDLEARSKKNKYYYAIGIGVLCIVIIGLIVYYKKQQRKNKELFQKLMTELEEKRHSEKRKEKTKKTPDTAPVSEKSNTSNKEIPEIDKKTAEILQKLEVFEAKELFLSQESTLVEVAKKIQTNTTYLSKVINTYKEKSFTAYITDLRVAYAIERLSVDRKFRSFTIGAIAQEIGFKRSESFSKAFKVKTGLYPSYFIKELEKQ